jgi:tRNA(Ile)-lysidine synthase
MLLAHSGLEKDVEAVNVADVRKLLDDGMTGKRTDLDRSHAAVREAGWLIIYPCLPERNACEPVKLKIPGRTETALGAFVCELLDGLPGDYRNPPQFVRYMDFDALPEEIAARGRLPGDRFRPLNSPGTRKLKETLIAAKTARYERDSLALIASGCDVLWPVGFTVADNVKITDGTRRVLKITYFAKEEPV